MDAESDSVYFMASPKNPTQRYLYRVKLDGTGLDAGHARRISRARTTTRSRRTRMGDPPLFGVRHAAHRRTWSACPSMRRFECSRRTRPSRPSSQSSRTVTTEFFRVDIGERRRARRLVHPAAGLRSEREISRCSCTSTVSRPARRSLDRWGGGEPSLAPDARPERLRRDELRQPRHARAARPGLAEGRLPPGRHPGARGSGRGGARPCCEQPAVPRQGPHRRLGLERRRIDDA